MPSGSPQISRPMHDDASGACPFEDVQTAYIQLRGLDLKDPTASLGRYLLEDFAHYVATRNPADDKVLLIVDEFLAIAFGGANAANRSSWCAFTAQAWW
jgi:hypothetical protein